jgi:hypothetical protein
MKTTRNLIAAVSLCFMMSGCAAFVGPGRRSVSVNDVPIFDRYYLTNLKQSNSADIIGAIATDGTELMSQSQSVIASWKEEKKGYVFWFNMVAFDEEDLSAARKYCLVFDEKATQGFWFIFPIQKLRFEAAMVLGKEILDEPYANENEKRIAVMKEILAQFTSDSEQLTADSSVLSSSSMLVKQTINTMLNKLAVSPAIADKLDDLAGLQFDHITLGKGRVRMLIEGDVVKFKVKIGSNIKNFDKHPDVLGM